MQTPTMRKITLITLGAVGAVGMLGSGCKKKEAEAVSEVAIPVQVLPVQSASIARVLAYDADVQGELEVKVFAQVAERIVSLTVEEGTPVKRGQVLAVLRAESLTEGVRSAVAAVDAARAERDNVQDELKRAEKLVARNIVSRAQVDQLRARLLTAEAQIRRLEAMSSQASTAKGYATIVSPLTGVVGRRYLSQGDMAAPSAPILTVVQADRVDLWVEVPEADLAMVRDGMAATVRVQRYPGERFQGKVALVSPTIDRQTRTARVKVRVPNTDHRLMSGMLARVELEVERHAGVVVVPYSSLIIESGVGGKVIYRGFVVQGNRARERVLTVGIIDGPQVEITSGLSVGELLVTRGQHLLDNDRQVEAVERLTEDGAKTGRGDAKHAPSGEAPSAQSAAPAPAESKQAAR